MRRHVRLPRLLIRPAVTSGNTLVVLPLLLPEVTSGTAVECVPSKVDSFQNRCRERPGRWHQHMETRQQGQPHSHSGITLTAVTIPGCGSCAGADVCQLLNKGLPQSLCLLYDALLGGPVRAHAVAGPPEDTCRCGREAGWQVLVGTEG